ncbi:cytidine deaminase [Desulfosporosinus metallidurans]|uniref:Cytidine deaminase n=1 Tax=Desulfosporosinus metallidurans TaxID=1888891 RepID=A0A1Q8QT10_9FIRM|nr:cytidine deaminase [Desulfosporosinus metallidurans]OLN30467.1 Cytidine deaminase [Desulfosporosinus metallidurans]
MKQDEAQALEIIEPVHESENEVEVQQELIHLAKAAYQQAYVPYSHYPVGAAVLFSSGKIYSGCNVENASYGLTVCAERNAIFQAVAQGERKLKGIAIAVPTDEFPSPCGACRQVIREFAVDCPVILINGQGETRVTNLKTLLPDAFGPEYL